MNNKTKKFAIICSIIVSILLGGVGGFFIGSAVNKINPNYTNEMKMEYRKNYDDNGANSVERKGDHEDSQYFYNLNSFLNNCLKNNH